MDSLLVLVIATIAAAALANLSVVAGVDSREELGTWEPDGLR